MRFYAIDKKLINVDNVDYIERYQDKAKVTRIMFSSGFELVANVAFDEIKQNVSTTELKALRTPTPQKEEVKNDVDT